MNILIAPDSFKESLTAIEVCQAIKSGVSQVFPEASYTLLPLADGGEGTTEILSYVLEGRWQQLTVHDPLMRSVTAKYFLTSDKMAIIEIAEACGLHLLTIEERNPMITTSFGVGEMITDAINQGAKRIFIGLGGSATNDAGVGMLQALGVRFLDSFAQDVLPGGANLAKIKSIDLGQLCERLADVTFTVACDVTSPLCGPMGASQVFGPQKGASIDDLKILDNALQHFADISSTLKVCLENQSNYPGVGAAGGLGYAFKSFCNAELTSGFDAIARLVSLDAHLAAADLVFTGEGMFDAQTAMGKVASGVAKRAKAYNLPVIAICGAVERSVDLAFTAPSVTNLPLHTPLFDIVVPSVQKVESLPKVLAAANHSVTYTAYQIANALKVGSTLSNKL